MREAHATGSLRHHALSNPVALRPQRRSSPAVAGVSPSFHSAWSLPAAAGLPRSVFPPRPQDPDDCHGIRFGVMVFDVSTFRRFSSFSLLFTCSPAPLFISWGALSKIKGVGQDAAKPPPSCSSRLTAKSERLVRSEPPRAKGDWHDFQVFQAISTLKPCPYRLFNPCLESQVSHDACIKSKDKLQ